MSKPNYHVFCVCRASRKAIVYWQACDNVPLVPRSPAHLSSLEERHSPATIAIQDLGSVQVQNLEPGSMVISEWIDLMKISGQRAAVGSMICYA